MADQLRTLLAHNIVRFTFRKVDGTIRTAVGTRNLALAQAYLRTKPETRYYEIPTPKGEEQPNSYYDVEKNGWRSYRPESIMPTPFQIVPVENPVSTPAPVKPVEHPTPTPTREIPMGRKPVSTPTEKGGEMPTGGFGFGGFGGGLPLGGFGGGKGEPVSGGKVGGMVGTPTFNTDGDFSLPVGAVSVEDFAKLVAKYVVDLLAYRLNK